MATEAPDPEGNTLEGGIKESELDIEFGSTGLLRFSGYVYEEYFKKLQGVLGAKIYREMSDNEPVVGSFLFLIEMFIRNVEWHAKPVEEDNPEDVAAAEFIQSCMDDMEHSWQDFMAEACSMLQYGWAFHEVVYKLRMGDEDPDPTRYSKLTDGLMGWRKIPIRAQETLQEWVFADNGDILAMKQMAPPTYKLATIPIEKAVLFRTSSRKNNPEGRSVLRNAYRPWYFKKKLEDIEAIGVERDLAGLPIVKIPGALLKATASAEDRRTATYFKRLVTNIRRDQQEGIVMPSDTDAKGHPLYELSLLGSGSRRNFDTNPIIDRKTREILICVLADFIALGSNSKGSYSLADVKVNLFTTAVKTWLGMMSGSLNRQLVPPTLQMNGMKGRCEITHGPIEQEDVGGLIKNIAEMSRAGAVMFPDDTLENTLRDLMHLPPKDLSAMALEQDGSGAGEDEEDETKDEPKPPVPPEEDED